MARELKSIKVMVVSSTLLASQKGDTNDHQLIHYLALFQSLKRKAGIGRSMISSALLHRLWFLSPSFLDGWELKCKLDIGYVILGFQLTSFPRSPRYSDGDAYSFLRIPRGGHDWYDLAFDSDAAHEHLGTYL